ncbi:MAG: hypothetical protein ACP5XB_28530 [Isosphaeraceae bacterium]
MTDEMQEPERKKSMSDFLILGAVLAAWIVLNRWLLPKMGVPT